MDKQRVVYTHNRILFSHKKEWSSYTCCNIDEPRKRYGKWNKPDRKTDIVWFHLCELSRQFKFIETKSRFEVTRVVGNEKLMLNGYRVSIWVKKNIENIMMMVAQHCEYN